MSRVRFTTQKLDAFQRALPKEVEQGVTSTTEAVTAGAKALVAVDTGDLQGAIHPEGDGMNQAVVVDATEIPYAFAQEFGFTPAQLEAQGKQGYTYTPFMRPAAEGERERHGQRVAEAIQEAAR